MATAAELALLLKVQGGESIDNALKGVRSNLADTRAEAAKGGGAAALEAGCKQAWDGMKQMSAMCPKVKWE